MSGAGVADAIAATHNTYIRKAKAAVIFIQLRASTIIISTLALFVCACSLCVRTFACTRQPDPMPLGKMCLVGRPFWWSLLPTEVSFTVYDFYSFRELLLLSPPFPFSPISLTTHSVVVFAGFAFESFRCAASLSLSL